MKQGEEEEEAEEEARNFSLFPPLLQCENSAILRAFDPSRDQQQRRYHQKQQKQKHTLLPLLPLE